MQTFKRVLLTGGGTAGHVNPALAIGSAIGTPETRFLFVGVRGRVEEEVVPREGIPIKFVRASGLPSGISASLIPFALNLAIGILQSLYILLVFRPEVIVGTGGYASAPVVIAASILRRIGLSRARIFIHEQNAVPGKLNRLMGRFAHQVFITFPETLSFFPRNGILSGYPLRKRITRVSLEEARQKIDFAIPEGRKIVLVFGGSQGSRTINRALTDALQHLIPYRDRIFIIHGVGLLKTGGYNAVSDTEARLHSTYNEQQLREIGEFYVSRPFFHNIELLYAVSNLAVIRGGAGSLNEISTMGLPALIIPKSNLPGNHQVLNARAMERASGAEILYEEIAPVNGRLDEWVDGKILAGKLLALLQDESRLKEMSGRSSVFLIRDALGLIERRIRGVEAPADQSFYAQIKPGEDIHLPDNRTLLTLLERAAERNGSAYAPENVIVRPQDLEFLKNRAAALLIHPSWPMRNLGVKLLGLLKAKEKIPALLTIFNDRTPASWIKRIFGGDFEQVGFIRRNIISAIIRLNEVTPEIEAVLLTALRDPYYEVRSEAAHAAASFASRISSRKEFISALLKLLSDSQVDVIVAAAEALGKIGGEFDALPVLLSSYDAKLWKVRAAVLRGIFHLIKRGQVANLKTLEDQVPRFILTSTDFKPHFEIKAAYRQLMEAVSMEKEKDILK